MDTVYVHKYAGILSAYGMALADVIHEEQTPCVLEYSEVVGTLKKIQDLKIKDFMGRRKTCLNLKSIFLICERFV